MSDSNRSNRSNIRRIVLDVDFPSSGISIIKLASELTKVSGVKSVNVTVEDMDIDVLGLLIVVEGDGIDVDKLQKVIEDLGGVIRSIDQVIAGEYIVEYTGPPSRRER